jgi:arylsulfatase A-like enzyme
MRFTRRRFLASSVAFPALAAKKKKVEPLRPNVVLLVADNVPSWALGIYGNAEIKTPNLDRLAQTGIRFHNHFTASPTPGLGRTTLMTGLTAMQARESSPKIDRILAGAGYAGTWSGAATAAKFLDSQTAGKPFFLGVVLPGPRPPYDGIEPKYTQLYAAARFENFARDAAAPNAAVGREMLADRTASLRKYAAAVSAMDAEVGALVAALYQRKLIDNTLIVFTSSCGALLGRHGLWDAGEGSNPPNMYEESVNTPLIWSWSGRTPPGNERPEVVGGCDLVPTLCDMTGVEEPPANLSGRSYLLLATGKPLPKKERWRTTVFAQLGNTGMARDDRYKLVERDGGKGPGELYDLVADPVEKVNQYDNQQFLTVKTALAGALHGWQQKYSA